MGKPWKVVLSGALLLAPGCSPSGTPGYTRVVIEPPPRAMDLFSPLVGLTPFAAPTGIAAFFAVDASDPARRGRFIIPSLSSGGSEWVIPNGTYNFSVVAYDTGSPFDGAPACGQALGDDGT